MQENPQPSRAMMLKLLNNNIISQVISENKNFLFAGNRDGDIFVIKINDLETTEKPCTQIKVFHQGDDIEINSLCFYRKFLVVGAIGIIYGLEWNEEKEILRKTRSWEVKIPLHVDAIEVPDVNFMWLCREREMLYAGCGDNVVYQIDLEDGRIVRTYKGHSDYIHGVVGDEKGRLYTASEDGTVRVWSEREQNCQDVLEINKNSNLARPEFGGFVGAVAVKDDWLLCGGSPKLSMWHLHSLKCAKVFPFPGKVHVCDFVEGEIVVGGEHKSTHIYSFNGDLLADIPVEHTAVYSIAWQSEPVKFMSIAGYDNQLHILKQFRFLDTKIPLYGNTVDGEEDWVDEDQLMEDDNNDNQRKKRGSRY